ncbi:hypothetical protein [Spiroplasma monobiae]|uniref:MOLPALP family lipoprotein n=1 Tax=Spiroplasma monobiae MQ-1 TaxID=1336748 RepID=A0A2K9LUG8_SPISQ|nr:hypothetical protein [Spiroplasma monobiae]AUM62561.1 hypothetical protein SMONO_v1c03120 [Spiroplasma monobiae MQ-1]
MKKLISFLGIIAITASTGSVAACSTVNNIKTSIKNKVDNLMKISSAALRGAMIQNASQDMLANGELAYDAEYLNGLINSGKANSLIPDFKTDSETTVGSLMSNYFGGQSLSRDAINELNKSGNGSYGENDFLTNQVKSPNGSGDSIGSILTLVISAIKSNGGIHPSISGLIQGLLPQLGLSPSGANGVGKESMESVASILDNASVPLAILLKSVSGSNAVYSLISNLLNATFLNDMKEGKTNITNGLLSALSSINIVPLISGIIELLNEFDILIPLMDDLINSILTMDSIESMTNKQIMNATNKRLYNIFATLSGQNDKIITDKIELYKDIDYNFEKQFGEVIAVFFENISSISTSNIVSIIPDILFVVAGLLQRITSVDFETNVAQSNSDLFNNNEDRKNKNQEFLKRLGSEKYKENIFSTKKLVKNLSIAFNSESENGLQLAKLFSLLLQTGSTSKSIDFGKPFLGNNIIGWGSKLLTMLPNISNDVGSHEGLSPLLYSLGYGIAVWQNISINIGIDIGKDQIGNLLRLSMDMIIQGSSIDGLNGLIELLNSFGVSLPIKFSSNSEKIMKNSWTALYSKNSTMLKDIIGGEENISLQIILAGPVYEGKTISEILDFIYKNIKSSSNNDAKFRQLKEEAKGIASGLQDISKALVEDKYKIFIKNSNKPYNGEGSNEENQYTALQALMITSGLNGLTVQIENNNIPPINGAKSAMYALGTDFDDNGRQLNKFRDNSLLSGLEKIIDDKSIDSLLDQIVKGFADVNKVKNDLSNTVYKPLIQSRNFKSKVKSHYGIDEGNVESGIVYVTTYTDPATKRTFNYEIKLLLRPGWSDWYIKSIKRV